jgi:hypothetical protein
MQSEGTKMPENTGALQESSRFKKGQSGNPQGKPKGARNKSTLAAEALLEGSLDKICKRVEEEALNGNMQAAKMILDRFIPVRKDRVIKVDLPVISTCEDVLLAIGYVVNIDIQKDKIVIYTSESVMGFMDVFSSMSEFFPKTPKLDIDNLTNRFGRYQAMLRFTLVDNEKRHFFAERWCFRGSVDDWITIYSLGSASLETLCEALFPHFGQESYYDLM